MLTFSGAPALSDFRLQKLLVALRERVGQIERRRHALLPFRRDDARRSTVTRRGCSRPCCGMARRSQAREPQGELLLVVPRFGTVSPWSTKATDIAHVCGLRTVQRIERGVAYFLRRRTAADGGGTRARRGADSRPHDRKRARHVWRPRSGCSQHTAPKPLATVPVLAQGRAALEQREQGPRPGAVGRRNRLPRRRVPAAAAARSDATSN